MLPVNFCSAPFRGFYQGEGISVCCQTPVLVDSIDSPDIEKLRQDFLAGKYPDECSATSCTNQVRSDVTDMCNLWDNKDYSFYKPVFLDLLWSNKCNFSCLGCFPHISSGMKKFTRAVEIANGTTYTRKNEWKAEYDLDYIMNNLDSIKIIHLNGGEPFLQDGFYDLLEKLIEHNATDVIIWAHTNGSVGKYKNKDIVELLKKFNQSFVIMSNDGIGERGEYNRYGLKERIWLKNFKRMQDAGITVQIQTCYNVFNALQLSEMADFFPVKSKLTVWAEPACYSGKYLQQSSLYEKAMEILHENKNRYHQVDSVINFMEEKSNEDYRMRFSESISEFDRIRGTDFIETFPELEELYY